MSHFPDDKNTTLEMCSVKVGLPVDALQDHLDSALKRLHACAASRGNAHGNLYHSCLSTEQNKMVPVEQTVVHEEAAASHDEALLSMQADEQFAADVEWLLHSTDTAAQIEQHEFPRQEDVYIFRFGGGNTEAFRSALLHGPELGPCREALNQNFQHPSGALMFVNPEQLPDVLVRLETAALHPFHVIITDSKTYLVVEVLANMPRRQRPREKRSKRSALVSPPLDAEVAEQSERSSSSNSDAEVSSDSVAVHLNRTFLCVAPLLLDACTINQSTTEACSRGMNPRRLQCLWE